jgi:tetratricopeptide (TPR) repeat protein
MMLAELDLRKLPAVNANRYEKLKGTIMAQEGYLFRNQHLYRESLDCFRDAFDLDSLANDTVGMLFDLSDLGYVLTAARDNEQALHYFDLAAKMAEVYGDSLRLENIILQKCHCLVKLKRYVEVADYLQSFSPRLTRSNSEVYCTVFGEYFWKIGESEKAVPYFKRLYESGSIYSRSNAALWFSDYEMKRGNAKEAMRYMLHPSCRESGVIPVITPNWDHTPRSGRKGLVFTDCKPELFKQLALQAFDMVKDKPAEERIVMLKSWNEWGEGNYMEPDLEYGHGYIDALAAALKEYE